MSLTPEVVLATVLKWPVSQRAELARDLIASLESEPPEDEDECDAAWTEEIIARSDAYQRGEITALDWRESMKRVWQEFEAPKVTS